MKTRWIYILVMMLSVSCSGRKERSDIGQDYEKMQTTVTAIGEELRKENTLGWWDERNDSLRYVMDSVEVSFYEKYDLVTLISFCENELRSQMSQAEYYQLLHEVIDWKR